MFDRYRPAIAVFLLAVFQMSLWFMVVAAQGENPMPAILYGREAAVSDALTWATLQAGLSGFGMMGCIFRIEWITFGSTFALGVMFVILAAAGFSALPGGTAVAGMSSGAAPMCFTAAWVSWGGRRGSGR